VVGEVLMYEIDFLPVESESGLGSKSGDAIAMRFSCVTERRPVVVVIDGGYTGVGEDLVDHIKEYYGTSQVDLVISTHPDQDHINGLVTVVEQLDVGELMVHQPRKHFASVADFSNIEAVDKLLKAAANRNVPVSEPFAGEQRFGGQITILGPDLDYYMQLIREHLREEREGTSAKSLAAHALSRSKSLVRQMLSFLPIETLDNESEVSPRNNSSAITLLEVDDERKLFTGDAGIDALTRAADYCELLFGSFSANPLSFFQAPHHGSQRNVGPVILDRILGPKEMPYRSSCSAVCSSAKASEKHPSPKVVNALMRRGCVVTATEGRTVCHNSGINRFGWGPIEPMVPMVEDDD
jgi:beta-lactamase superfamily II metal-dependent hydrolase